MKYVIAAAFIFTTIGAAQAQDTRPDWLALQLEIACNTYDLLASPSTCECVVEASFENITDDNILDDFTNRVEKRKTTKLEDYWFERTLAHCSGGSSIAQKAKQAEPPLIKGLDD